MARHRFTFDISFRHVVEVEAEPGMPRARAHVAATSYLARQLALMDWEDLLCHAHEVIPVDGVPDEAADPQSLGRALPQAVIVPIDDDRTGQGFEFHADDPGGRGEGYIRLSTVQPELRRIN